MDSFSNEVKYCGAHKLDYSVWKSLHKWATEDKWSDWEFCICDIQKEMLTIFPWDELRVSPDMVSITKTSDFSQFLLKNLKGMENMNSNYSYSGSTSTIDNCLNQTNVSKLLINDYDCPWTIEFDSPASCVDVDNKSLTETVKEIIDKYENEKEKNNSMNFNFDFGPVDSSVRMSMYGMAIKNASGTYVAYDAKSGQIMDVDILNFEGANKFIYKMPATLSQIAVGDVVIHARKPMFVQEVRKDNRLCVMDIFDGEEKTIVPAKSPFGFDFVTKVVSLFDFNSSADASNPFGNMLPFLMLSDSNRTDTENLLPLMLMTSGNMDMSNPMMLWALMGNRTNDPIMLAMAMGAFKQPTHNCTCGDNCSCKENK